MMVGVILPRMRGGGGITPIQAGREIVACGGCHEGGRFQNLSHSAPPPA
jgi:hypothetical protein